LNTLTSFDSSVKERYRDGLWEKAGENLAAYAMSNPVHRATAKTTKPGVMALYCPHCGAPITLAAPSRFHNCEYCKTTLLLPVP
jgi:hypothetical protein